MSVPVQPFDEPARARSRLPGIDSTAGIVLASFLFACLLSISVFPDVWRSMVRVWSNSETFAHGFIALPCAAWMLWRRRDDWSHLPHETWWPATLALAACGLLWLVGRLAGVASIEQLGAVGVIPATMLLLVGPTVTRAIAFPLAFLFFAVPVGEFLTPIMMEYTADATVAAVRWSGVPVFREGLHFTLPTGRWSVVEACSGLRYLIASLALGVLYAYLQFRTLRYRLAFVALAILVPIVANWIRAYGIVMLGHLSDMKLAAGADHLIYGWLFFGVVMALLFWIGSRWHEPAPADGEDASGAGEPPAEKQLSMPNPWAAKGRIGFALAAIVVVVLWRPVSTTLLDQAVAIDGVGPLRAAVDSLPPAAPLDYQPRFESATSTLRATRAVAGVPVDLHAFHYVHQHDTGEMVHDKNRVVRTDDFQLQLLSRSTERFPWGTVTAYRLRPQGVAPLLVWHWYAVGSTQTASPYAAKAATAWSLLSGRGDHSLALVLATPIEPADGVTPSEQWQAGARRLDAMASRLQPAIRAILQPAGGDAGPRVAPVASGTATPSDVAPGSTGPTTPR